MSKNVLPSIYNTLIIQTLIRGILVNKYRNNYKYKERNSNFFIPIEIKNVEETKNLPSYQKVKFKCSYCEQEVIRNTARVRDKEELICKGCLISKRKAIKKTSIEENQKIKSLEEIKNTSEKNAKLVVLYNCEKCGKEIKGKIANLKYKENLLCPKCASAFKNFQLYGVKTALQLKKNRFFDGRNFTEKEKEKQWFQIRETNWLTEEKYKRKEKWFEKDRGLKIIDFDKNLMVLTLRCVCGHYQKVMVDTSYRRIFCEKCFNDKPSYTVSYEEQQFVNNFKMNFPEVKIIQSYKGWAKGFKYSNLQEIDLFLPDLNIGFEFNGIFYHDKNNPLKEILKSKRAKESNISLYHVWQDDWRNNRFKILGEINGLLYFNLKEFNYLCRY